MVECQPSGGIGLREFCREGPWLVLGTVPAVPGQTLWPPGDLLALRYGLMGTQWGFTQSVSPPEGCVLCGSLDTPPTPVVSLPEAPGGNPCWPVPICPGDPATACWDVRDSL